MAKRNKEALLMALAQALRAFVVARQHSSDMAERRQFMSRNDARENEYHQARMENLRSLVEARNSKATKGLDDDASLMAELKKFGVPSSAKGLVVDYLSSSEADRAVMRQEWLTTPSVDPMEGGDPELLKELRIKRQAIDYADRILKHRKHSPSSAPSSDFTDEDYVKTLEQTPTNPAMGSKLIDGMVGGPGAGMRDKLSTFGPQPRSPNTGSDEWVQNLTNTMTSNEPSDVAERQRTIAQSMPQANGTPLDQRLAGEFAYYQSLVFNPNTPLHEQAIAYAKLANYGIEPPADIKEMLWGSGQSLASLREGVRDPSMLGFGTVGMPQIQAAMQNPSATGPIPPEMMSIKAMGGSRMASGLIDGIVGGASARGGSGLPLRNNSDLQGWSESLQPMPPLPSQTNEDLQRWSESRQPRKGMKSGLADIAEKLAKLLPKSRPAKRRQRWPGFPID